MFLAERGNHGYRITFTAQPVLRTFHFEDKGLIPQKK
jgi:hypothetical protein